MLCESKLIQLTILSTLLCLVLSVAFTFTKRIQLIQESGLFLHIPSEIGQKYALEIAPGKTMSEISHPVIALTKLTALYFLWRMHDGKRRIFRESYYRAWIASMIATTFWLFLFDRELHLECFVMVCCVYVTSYFLLIQTCERLHAASDQLAETDIEMLPANSASTWKFRFFIVTSSIFQCVWVTLAMGSTVAFPLAYTPSNHVTIAIPSGIMSVTSASSVGLLFIMLTHLLYTAHEMTTYKPCRLQLMLFQPTFALGIVGVFLSNYDSEKGLITNSIFTLAIFVNATIAFAANVTMLWRETKSSKGKQE